MRSRGGSCCPRTLEEEPLRDFPLRNYGGPPSKLRATPSTLRNLMVTFLQLPIQPIKSCLGLRGRPGSGTVACSPFSFRGFTAQVPAFSSSSPMIRAKAAPFVGGAHPGFEAEVKFEVRTIPAARMDVNRKRFVAGLFGGGDNKVQGRCPGPVCPEQMATRSPIASLWPGPRAAHGFYKIVVAAVAA